MNLVTGCDLVVPYKNPKGDREHAANMLEIERWAHRFRRNCISSGSACAGLPLFADTDLVEMASGSSVQAQFTYQANAVEGGYEFSGTALQFTEAGTYVAQLEWAEWDEFGTTPDTGYRRATFGNQYVSVDPSERDGKTYITGHPVIWTVTDPPEEIPRLYLFQNSGESLFVQARIHIFRVSCESGWTSLDLPSC